MRNKGGPLESFSASLGRTGHKDQELCKGKSCETEQHAATPDALYTPTVPPCPHLHTIGKHDAHRHELGENLQQLRVGQHAVLQTVVKETCVVAKDIIDVGGLQTKV